jgi:hypothetical protein
MPNVPHANPQSPSSPVQVTVLAHPGLCNQLNKGKIEPIEHMQLNKVTLIAQLS